MMSTLTKADIANMLATETTFAQHQSKQLVDAFFEELRMSLSDNQAVKLSGFGNFVLRDKKPRPGRNPKTGESAVISARRVLTFKAGQKLKNLVRIDSD